MFDDDLDITAEYTVVFSNGETIENEFVYCNGTVFYNNSEIGIANDISEGNNIVSEYVEDNMADLLNVSNEEIENIEIEDVITIR